MTRAKATKTVRSSEALALLRSFEAACRGRWSKFESSRPGLTDVRDRKLAEFHADRDARRS